jgi:ribosomal-protein-alanine N-acetyltransferase
MDLITPRLVLREFREDDAQAYFAILADAENRRYEYEELTETEISQRFSQILSDRAGMPKTHYRFAITVSPDDTLRGWIALTLVNPRIHEYEIGWTVQYADWGNGYAPEAAREVLVLAFNRLKAHRVTAFCHPDNRASLRVMEKLGMHSEALLRETRWLNGAWADERVYALLEREFRG